MIIWYNIIFKSILNMGRYRLISNGLGGGEKIFFLAPPPPPPPPHPTTLNLGANPVGTFKMR